MNTIFFANTNVCSVIVLTCWMARKMSSTGLGCHGAEANCRIAHVLGIPLMISYLFAFYFSDVIVKNMGRRYEFFGSFTCLKSLENKKKKKKNFKFHNDTKVF